MKKIVRLFSLILIFQLASGFVPENNEQKQIAILTATVRSLQAMHYEPKEINDDFSKNVFNLYLQRLDFNKKYFTQEDIDKLSAYKTTIDDAIITPNVTFYTEAISIFKQRILDVKNLYPSILEKPFDFTGNDVYEADEKKVQYAKSVADLKNVWYSNLKFQTMVRLHELEDAQKKQIEKKDTSLKVVKTFAELEADARKKVAKSTGDFMDRITKMDDEEFFSLYINSITACFDPHTNFFPPKAKEDFDTKMSGKLEGIGATLQEKDNYIKIVSLVVGGPAWKTNKVKAEDLILKVAEEKSDWFTLENITIDKAVSKIRGKKGTTVRLQLRHADGSTEDVSIVRDVIVIEETYAKSSIIEINKKRIGIIDLPEFYLDFNNPNGRRSASDMKIEVEKLKADNVDGIIIDLRNNTGGSLSDVIDIAGMFIKSGPIVQVKGREGAPQILSDRDDDVIYTGPLAIMINEFSASASEILAAAIQDYNRGIIIGSPSSFGKGTVQRFYDLDIFYNGDNSNVRPLGAIKISNQKFYRINGGATQLKGVSSDIVLHDNLEYLETGEKKEDYPLKWNQIDRAKYEPLNENYSINELKKLSKIRTEQSAIFNEYDLNAKRIKKQDEDQTYELNYVKYCKQLEENKVITKKIEELLKTEYPITVSSTSADQPIYAADSNKTTKINVWYKSLKTDPYIYETSNVLLDMMYADNAKK